MVASPVLTLLRQTRVGKYVKPFTCHKLRTMYVNAPDIRNLDGTTFNAEDESIFTWVTIYLQKKILPRLICRY